MTRMCAVSIVCSFIVCSSHCNRPVALEAKHGRQAVRRLLAAGLVTLVSWSGASARPSPWAVSAPHASRLLEVDGYALVESV